MFGWEFRQAGVQDPREFPPTMQEAYAVGYRYGYARGRQDARGIFGSQGSGVAQDPRSPLTMTQWRYLMTLVHPDRNPDVMAPAVTQWLISMKPEG